MKQDFRIHVTIRRRGQPVNDSVELKTEGFDSHEDVAMAAASWVVESLNELEEESDGSTD